MSQERLQKILSQAGVASRRASEQLMLDGRVTVNGTTMRELGTKADPARDDIRVDGRRVKLPERHRYILLNKPRGYVTTRSDPHQRPTVIDLIAGVRDYVYPVGRLDFDTEGLLILTNDGDLAARLTHPRHGVARVYEARVLGVPDAHDIARLAKGIVIEGRRTQPAHREAAARAQRRCDAAKSRCGKAETARSGTCARRSATRSSSLRRVAIGPIRDPKLRLGRWRDLSDAEVARLQTRPPATADQTRNSELKRKARGPARRDRGPPRRTRRELVDGPRSDNRPSGL